MKIIQVKVSADRTTSNPFEKYSNFRCHFELTAEIEAGDDYTLTLKDLQERIETICDDHKEATLLATEQRNRIERTEGKYAARQIPFGQRVGDALEAIERERKEPPRLVEHDFTRKKRKHGL